MNAEAETMPELKQIVGALIFASQAPVTVAQIRKTLALVAEIHGGAAAGFGRAREADVLEAIQQLRAELDERKLGIHIAEVAHGFKLQNDRACGAWVRQLLERGKPSRLSRPALETLAIIAYRQPCVRSEIEAVRGVQVDQILRNLLEMQLVRIAGRSELPGRPLLLATTEKFLEYFGLKSLQDLPGIDELRRRELERIAKSAVSEDNTSSGAGAEVAGDASPGDEEDEDEDDEEDEDEDEDEEGGEGEEEGKAGGEPGGPQAADQPA